MSNMELLALAVSFSETNLKKAPECSKLEGFAMAGVDKFTLNDSSIRDQLYSGILQYATQSPDIKYDCSVELAGGLVLDDPAKDFRFLMSNGRFPLISETDGNSTVEVATQAALKLWEKHIPNVRKASCDVKLGPREAVGCNYVFEDDRHKYICIFV
ncbi:hypothetical protein NECAME_15526 [Necator americanus]|uniref:SCP domain-containing protein n=1 Tax=Necator americanus TaxID=51031 RepID=W2SHQ0_NECAM|nr:hypothetical protein NECAME_15526 [Necator americanus]ETN69093.1 hypothetical protein NECAME_15526 [Necator americanus]